MPKYKFLRAIGCKTADGRHQKDFMQGVHEVDEVYLKTAAFLANVKAGNIVEPEVKVVVTTETLAERAQRLHEKLAKAPAPNETQRAGTPVGELTEAQKKKLKEEEDAAEWARMEAEEAASEKTEKKKGKKG